MYKLMGHRDHVTQLDVVHADKPLLLSSGKDGVLKLWDLTQQCCILNHNADELLSKITCHVLVPQLNCLVVGLSTP